MSNLILLYDNAADEGTLSGGLWTMPLANLQDPSPTTITRSTNLQTTSTTWRVQLTSSRSFKAIVFGPTNFSSGASYRIRAYSDSGYSVLVDDTSAVIVGSTPISTLDASWSDPFWWSGAQPIEDPGGAAGGIWIIHIYETPVNAQYWEFDIDNSQNPDGFIQIGRLFMGMAYVPTNNISVPDNKVGFDVNTTMVKAASGARFYNRRRAARTFDFALPILPQDEANDDIYRIAAISGIDKQVFVIPDPDDVDRLSKRCILGNLVSPPAWSFDVIEGASASTSFQVIESI